MARRNRNRKRKLCSCGQLAGMLPVTGRQLCRSCTIRPYLSWSEEFTAKLLAESVAAAARQVPGR